MRSARRTELGAPPASAEAAEAAVGETEAPAEAEAPEVPTAEGDVTGDQREKATE